MGKGLKICTYQREVPSNSSFVFAGMRGAVCFALVLYMEVEKEKKSVILTTTLFLILFTTLFLGGTVMPFVSFINKCYPEERPRRRRRNLRKHKDTVMMSKTQEMVGAHRRVARLSICVSML